MQQYDVRSTAFADGDYLVIAQMPAPQCIPRDVSPMLEQVDEIVVDATPATWLRTMSKNPPGGYYGFGIRLHSPPWLISTNPVERFVIYRIAAPDGS